MTIQYGPILVVEDVPNILDLLAMTLRFKGYPVLTASNGQEAWNTIQNEHPAMVITDILMPKMDGFNLVQKVRTNPQTSTIPIMFLSATYITREDQEFAMQLGVVRFLEKPVDTENFLLTVAELLTDDPATVPPPMGEEEFYRGYRARLESKLRYKNGQIARTERLLETLPENQKSAFRALLTEEIEHRDQIQEELDNLFRILDEHKDNALEAS